MLSEFRNDFNPRVAVTVDMIATGTDVKPLECLLFMRTVNSSSYFEQMKGWGCRVIDDQDLWKVASEEDVRRQITKDRFVIVDAVGVTESCKTDSKPIDRKPSVALDKVMDLVGKGVANYDVASTLASRLNRLLHKLTDDESEEISRVAGGVPFATLVGNLMRAVDDDAQEKRAVETFKLPPETEPTEEQLAQAEQAMIAEALKPFHDANLRRKILDIKRSHEQVIDEATIDELLHAGFNDQALKRAGELVTSFKQFIEEHKDELEAIKVFYSRPRRDGLKYAHLKQLAAELSRPPVSASPDKVWTAFTLVEPGAVKGQWSKLVDVIALVRHVVARSPPSPRRSRNDTRRGSPSERPRERRSRPTSAAGSMPSNNTSPRACRFKKRISTTPRSPSSGVSARRTSCSEEPCRRSLKNSTVGWRREPAAGEACW